MANFTKHLQCAICGTALPDINAACPNCLPNFYQRQVASPGATPPGEDSVGLGAESSRPRGLLPSKEESYRNALAAIRQETRSDPADLETAVGNLRSIYDITNMALFAGDAGFTSPVETSVAQKDLELPWHVDHMGASTKCLYSAGGWYIADIFDDKYAKYIVEACNAYRSPVETTENPGAGAPGGVGVTDLAARSSDSDWRCPNCGNREMLTSPFGGCRCGWNGLTGSPQKASEQPCTCFIPFNPLPGPHHSPSCARHTEQAGETP